MWSSIQGDARLPIKSTSASWKHCNSIVAMVEFFCNIPSLKSLTEAPKITAWNSYQLSMIQPFFLPVNDNTLKPLYYDLWSNQFCNVHTTIIDCLLEPKWKESQGAQRACAQGGENEIVDLPFLWPACFKSFNRISHQLCKWKEEVNHQFHCSLPKVQALRAPWE